MNKKTTKKEGLCALTGNRGLYVKAHIIPLAVTRLDVLGERARQTGLDVIPGWRSTSWYDDELVTQSGEDILKAIDSDGINDLKKHKLIWSGWQNEWNKLPEEYISHRFSEHLAVRKLDNVSFDAIRLLYLSILWRSISSKRKEMAYVKNLSTINMDLLRDMVINRNPSDYFKFPMVLNQISTRGTLHNRTPIFEERAFDDITLGCYRIYFNGLVCSIYDTVDENIAQKFDRLVLKNNAENLVLLNTWESSREYEEMKAMMQDGLYKETFIKNAKGK
ncbi:hypothetical protein EATA6166_04310 [Enterobacter asburiae]|uniref:hypothetical protein n=1 Tax=Enterobacter asburiae TaxID=61645 RepID=UPI0028DE5052|nr:hypothetical protein [Enterobacter asburiae]ELK6490099.1 hypothetical protein [Enterobacter bugandensis]BEK72539.1 hypothetical protein EATA6166_04310 [Enterobacter asburiae]HEB5889735.1 hypothetical protein [Enterobacter asburiae]